ncbi:MAG: hypothetical protein IT159_09245 [Bryobacterales bacterium]|nr:hypothetical protein [Bryobacterales bacterium]
MAVREGAVPAQVERILQSEAFRNAETLRRLLRFLADQSLSGKADQLKEYTVGIDALGKPATYDPRQDSVVRIQVGRLRQKLAEYYREEGREDPVVLDLPKGRFKLAWRLKDEAEQRNGDSELGTRDLQASGKHRLAVWLGAALALSLVWAALASVQLWRERRANVSFRKAWTPELEALWQPFLTSTRPVLVSASAPLFVALPGAGFYRDPALNSWEEVERSQRIEAIRRALKAPAVYPRYSYASSGVVSSLFHLGKLLAIADMQVSLAPSSQLSWQQMSDNNVILVGASRIFAEQLRGLPADLPLALDERGVRNLRPEAGQPAMLADDFPSITDETATGRMDEGEVFAVVTHAPGPLGSSEVRSFNSNHSPGTLGAVRAFTSPVWAGTLVKKLRTRTGSLPDYYQILLKVRYKDAVPTDVTYVLHHEIQPSRTPAPTGK